ncbi:hypothetical protein G210_3926 [Candida maltosa Xu316]|uniref:Uncharacterized protein n=1 Tax=Candida maltosa (strain Xu316) TaxID=1245528 RepID=M3IHP3_CANMX|nr:hypothetical protein G210_3926 [Candida maltosa Xu316]
MFTRRKTRSVHQTAYTGVGRSAPSNQQQPNSGALAAALTIGNAMKSQQPPKQPANKIPRSTSFQYKPPTTTTTTSQQQQQSHHNNSITSTGSLLKRGSRSSIQHTNATSSLTSSSAGIAPPSRRFSTSSQGSSNSSRNNSPLTSSDSFQHPHHTHVYDIDDSFNDSYLDEITEESTQTYLNNKANLNDLRLPKQKRITTNSAPPSNPAAAAAAAAKTSSGPVKMVKKYVPSPTGIKVIEVPESEFQKEVARSNSMRSNSLMSRSGSLRNTSLTKKNNIPRSSSLTGLSKRTKPVGGATKSAAAAAATSHRSVSSPLRSMHEEVALEESLGKSDELHEQELKVKALEKEIEEEKKLAAQIELKRKEYEQLKKTRLENEQKLRDLEHNINDSNVSESTVIHNSILETPEEVEEQQQHIEERTVPESVPKINEEEEDEEDVPIQNLSIAVDELEKKHIDEAKEEPQLDSEAATDSVRVAVPTVHVEQDEKIEKPVLSGFDEDNTLDGNVPDTISPGKSAYESVSEDEREFKSLDPNMSAELGVIDQYQNLGSTELLQNDVISSVSFEEPGTAEEDEDDDDEEYGKSNLAETLRPKFEESPEIIEPIVTDESDVTGEQKKVDDTSYPESNDTLLPPGVSNDNSSKSSIYSGDSQKKPIKSAMKSSSSFSVPTQTPPSSSSANTTNNNNGAAKSSAAHQAYLSLTTAENTRLNSKLSNPSFGTHPDYALPANSGSGAYPQFASRPPQGGNVPTKRLSQQTLRKPPQQQQQNGRGGFAGGFSNRPQSMQHYEKIQGMSNRSLRPNSVVQPISPHPALQPGYQSPSKLKAQALYAKAQARPFSEFKPQLNKASSFSKDVQQQHQQQQQSQQQPQNLKIQPPTANVLVNDGVPPRSPNRSEPKRTTLRSPSAPSAPQNNGAKPVHPQAQHKNNFTSQVPANVPQQQQQAQSRPFQSRFNDSDDEVPRRNFTSRFNDSDEDVSSVPAVAITSLRREQEAASPKKEKKFKKLRKLFGGSRD